MKRYIYIIWLIWTCSSCQERTSQHQHKNIDRISQKLKSGDTLSILSLQNKKSNFLNYSVILIRLSDLDKSGYRIKIITVTKNNNEKMATIVLPNSEDVKNFSISKIEQTVTGFKIIANWGGGNYFYRREFYFTNRMNEIYLDSINMNSYIHESEIQNNETKIINPPIPINKFEILNYLNNE